MTVEIWRELQDNCKRSREMERAGELEKNAARDEELEMESRERWRIWRELVVEKAGDGEN